MAAHDKPRQGSVTPVAPQAGGKGEPVASSSDNEVAAFVAKVKSLATPVGQGKGRLVFAMDATMSRQPTWDLALSLQGQMFQAVKEIGGLDVQLVYFRGLAECRASRWVGDPETLARLMASVSCQGGETQIGRVLGHAIDEAGQRRLNALVYVGDCVEEDIDRLCAKAGELALLGVPVFVFQEGRDAAASRAFAEIARLTRGAHCRFDAGSAAALRELLAAVAVFAAGGQAALRKLSTTASGEGARRLLEQIGSPKGPSR